MMNKIFKILIAGIFITGFIASVICLVCSSRITMNCCHNQAQPVSAGDDSCLAHCLKQKTFAVNPENQALEELKDQSQSFRVHLAVIKLQAIPTHFKSGLEHINKPVIKLNSGQLWFTPLLNHAPPIFF
jgi:hypothetical protein